VYKSVFNNFLFNNQADARIIQNYSVTKLYVFPASTLPIIRSTFGTGKFHAGLMPASKHSQDERRSILTVLGPA